MADDVKLYRPVWAWLSRRRVEYTTNHALTKQFWTELAHREDWTELILRRSCAENGLVNFREDEEEEAVLWLT